MELLNNNGNESTVKNSIITQEANGIIVPVIVGILIGSSLLVTGVLIILCQIKNRNTSSGENKSVEQLNTPDPETPADAKGPCPDLDKGLKGSGNDGKGPDAIAKSPEKEFDESGAGSKKGVPEIGIFKELELVKEHSKKDSPQSNYSKKHKEQTPAPERECAPQHPNPISNLDNIEDKPKKKKKKSIWKTLKSIFTKKKTKKHGERESCENAPVQVSFLSNDPATNMSHTIGGELASVETDQLFNHSTVSLTEGDCRKPVNHTLPVTQAVTNDTHKKAKESLPCSNAKSTRSTAPDKLDSLFDGSALSDCKEPSTAMYSAESVRV